MSWFVAVVLLILAYRVAVGLPRVRRTLRASREQRDRFDRDNLERLLRHLLISGFDGGWMMLEDRSSRLRVQYKKYVRSDAEIGLEQVFPRAAWAEPYYDGLQHLLRDRHIDFTRVVVQEEDAPPEYISIDYRKDVSLATDVALEIFADLFRLREPRLKIDGEGIGFSRVPVTRQGYPTFREQLREICEHLLEMWNLARNRRKP